MSQAIENEARGSRSWLSRHSSHVSALIGLTIVWLLFGDEVTLGKLVTGLLISLAVIVLLPLPDVRFNGRARPWGLVQYFVRFGYDVVIASIDVARLAVRRSPPRGAIVAIGLHTRSEFHLTVTALTLTLIPGSVIVDIDRTTSTLYFHVLHVGDRRGVEAFRRQVLKLELRVLRAIGSDEDLERATADMPRWAASGETRERRR